MMIRWAEFLGVRAEPSGILWKFQMAAGVLLILTALVMVVLPELLVALVASGVLIGGAAMVVGAWRTRRMSRRARRVTVFHRNDW